MGGLLSRRKNATPADKAAKSRSNQIDKTLAGEKKKQSKMVKLLLLGTGAAGKSTVAKQLQIIFLDGFKTEERMLYKRLIGEHIVETAQVLLRNLEGRLKDDAREHAELIKSIDPADTSFEFNADVAGSIRVIWDDPVVKSTFKTATKLHISDSASYFLNDVEKFCDDRYEPSDTDILRVRIRTTGIIETKFDLSGFDVHLLDVGGQRNERRKWMHCFDDVTAIIYVASLSEYDQVCEEDAETNRMVESMNVFRDVINNRWFADTPIILFLNKVDLFDEKIHKVNLGEYFSKYKSGKNRDKALKFIKDEYTKCNDNSGREIYIRETCATDTENIETVFNAVQDIFLNNAVREAGINM